MIEVFEDSSYWYLLGAVLDWLKVFTATYLGFRLVRAFERRPRMGSSRHALQRRVDELEQVTASLEAQMQQVLEADRFASALLLKPSAGERRQQGEQSPH